MKKIVSFLIVLVATATASASTYNTELLADSSFEASELTFGNYYWNEAGNISLVSNDNTTGYFEAGTQVNGGLFSMKYEVAGNGGTQFADLSLNDTRNSGGGADPFTSNQGVVFNAIDTENLSYSAGDTVEFSVDVYLDSWDTNAGSGIEMRLVLDDAPVPSGPFVAASTSRVNSPTGSWQTLSGTHTFGSAFTGKISTIVASQSAAGIGDTNLAWIDNASIQVIPEPSTMMALAFGALVILRFAKFRQNV